MKVSYNVFFDDLLRSPYHNVVSSIFCLSQIKPSNTQFQSVVDVPVLEGSMIENAAQIIVTKTMDYDKKISFACACFSCSFMYFGSLDITAHHVHLNAPFCKLDMSQVFKPLTATHAKLNNFFLRVNISLYFFLLEATAN